MSLGSPGLGPKKHTTGLLSRFRKNNKKDLKKLVKDSGDPVFQGYLKKYKEKEAEWKSRWVEIRGGYIMWTSSKGGGRADYKDYVDLKGARLIDEASMNGLDALDQKPQRAAAVVYSVEKGKTKNLGTLKEKSALSREYSWRVIPRNGPSHIFAAEGDDQKEEWWKNILKCIHQTPGPAGFSSKPTGRPVLEDIPLFSGDKPISITKQQVEFDFLSVVGRGAYGRVIKVREKATGNIYVCKVLEKQAIIKHRMLKEVAKEQALLQKVDHTNIVDLISAFQTRDKIFLVMEFLSGGELFYHMTNEKSKRYVLISVSDIIFYFELRSKYQIITQNRFSTDRSRFYAAQLVLAIEYLHSLKIIHCDLKAENCVLTRNGYMKLTDFGFATTTHANEKIISRNGTPVYMAPEMIRVDRDVGYSYPVDVWSLGVLIYAMLTGYFPFHGETPAITLRYVCERDLAFPPDVVLTDDARDLLERCLDKDPKTRITSTQMKSHRYVYHLFTFVY